VLDHVGSPLGIGPYAGKREEVFKDWREKIERLALLPNVAVKLSGQAMRVSGFSFQMQPVPPSSEMLARAWKPYFDVCIEAFGCERSMFASNFPVDKGGCSYPVLWNAYKRFSAGYSEDERSAMFYRNAASVYQL
jgi:L-fuconolactonase